MNENRRTRIRTEGFHKVIEILLAAQLPFANECSGHDDADLMLVGKRARRKNRLDCGDAQRQLTDWLTVKVVDEDEREREGGREGGRLGEIIQNIALRKIGGRVSKWQLSLFLFLGKNSITKVSGSFGPSYNSFSYSLFNLFIVRFTKMLFTLSLPYPSRRGRVGEIIGFFLTTHRLDDVFLLLLHQQQTGSSSTYCCCCCCCCFVVFFKISVNK